MHIALTTGLTLPSGTNSPAAYLPCDSYENIQI